ncbi:UbiA prenyltransferase [Roridomyces roridus]|uniref:UbiA prenyltransferase n=1 Tax=Roridomyces roridus TaxID=1738132 RepID=A0AAD7BR86_9AGAR|nr:UbiA prenyltransferase [Roridomyces roridus]
MALKSNPLVVLFFKTQKLLEPPTSTEIQACWELCRLHNNIGFWVVYLPTAWAIAMAYKAQPEITTLNAIRLALLYVPLCFGIKSLIMTIDDILDYPFDGQVERTKNRPLPRGAITLQRAWVFFGLQAVIGVELASQVLSLRALYVSMVVWPLYIIYPTCKRWTNLAPIPLGLMFKVGIFMAWSDITANGSIPWDVLTCVYLGAVLWTITYETVYQHQDILDDVKIPGMHSPALLLRGYTIPVCSVTAVGFLGLLALGGWLNGQGVAFYVSVGVAGCILLPTLLRTDIESPAECRAFFLTTPLVGQIILLGFVVDAIVHRIVV